MSAPPFELPKAHRWFGIEFNNAAWELVEAPSRTKSETERMLRLAHASCLHWESVGTPANQSARDSAKRIVFRLSRSPDGLAGECPC
jgi:hypothetical protein